MDVSSIALEGLQQANAQLEAAATAIATAGSDSNSGNVDVVDLSAEMVALMSAKTQLDLNLTTLKTADQMQQSLVDVKG